MLTNPRTEPRVYGPVRAWERTRISMDAAHATELAEFDVVRVEVDDPPTSWWVRPDSRVGVLSGAGWELRIDPRLRIPNLLFLLAYSQSPSGWRDIVARFGREDDLVAAVAAGFSWHAARALEPGVLRGYVSLEERRPDLRGRIRFGDQLAQLPGMPLPLEVTYDDFTMDIMENRMLVTAAELLLRLRRIPAQARSRLLRTRVTLDDVRRLRATEHVRTPPVTRLNSRYAAALALAELILKRRSISSHTGSVQSSAFLFDLNEVFESFLTTALTEALRDRGGRVVAQFPDNLDTEKGLKIKPDITWWRNERCVAVVDAKYKSLSRGESIPNADAYQMLAYCIALSVPRGFLIYAKDERERSRTYTIRRHGYVVEVRVVDLESVPSEVLTQVDGIAEEIANDAHASINRPELAGA
jgi:5-methylcytosine-specific restriction enzyme subunit McrC